MALYALLCFVMIVPFGTAHAGVIDVSSNKEGSEVNIHIEN